MAEREQNRQSQSSDELERIFHDEDAAYLFMVHLRWGYQVICPLCGSHFVSYNSNERTFWCSECLKKFSVRKGTIFEECRIPIRKILYTIHILLTSTHSIPSTTLSRMLDITQKSAWLLLQRIRTAFQTDKLLADLMQGIIEADEAYVGGKNKNKHSGKKLHGDAIYKAKIKVVGLREKSTKEVRCFIVDEICKENINEIIYKNVEKGSIICTDESNVYNDIEKDFTRMKVNHSKGIYTTEDGFTTNGIESFWSRLKRAYRTWIWISKKHVRKYIDEFEFRARLDGLPKITKGIPTYMFETLKSCFATPPIRYKELIGNAGAP